MKTSVRTLLIGALLMVGGVAGADEQPAFKLDLIAAPGLPNGKVRTIQGTARMPGDQFFIESAGVLQPVVITLIAQNEGDKIDIFIGKQRWDEKLKTGSTGLEGQITFKLRTQGEVRMTVLADGEPKPYWLVVYVGDEVKPELASVMTSMKTYKQSGGLTPGIPGAPVGPAGPGGGTVSYVIAAALVVIIVLLAMMILRRRGRQ
jgi:hypothetical protein